MVKKIKFNVATNRVGRNGRRKTAKKRTSVWTRVKNIIAAPFRWIARMAARIWKWIKSINVVGMINITLLVAIIVLFSMLIMDFVACKKSHTVIATNNNQPEITQNQVASESAQPTLPLKKDQITNVFISKTIQVVQVKADPVACKQIARTGKKLHGDIVIDSRGAARVLQDNTTVNGNLYLQNMRKYTLPCDVKINGNLFLRDMNMLNFCGKFTVNGNIYVSPRSSFGPLPRNAVIRGDVIL